MALIAAALVLRIAYVDARRATSCATTRSTTTSTRRSIAAGRRLLKTLAHGRPTAFRPPGYPYFLAAVYHVSGRRDRRASASTSRGSPRPSSGRRSSRWWACSRAAVGVGARRSSRSALGAIYLPADPRRRRGDVRAAVRRLHARLARGACWPTGARATAIAWALLAGVLGGLAALTRANAIILLVPLALAVWAGGRGARGAALGPPVVLVAGRAAHRHPVDDPQRARAPRLRAGLDAVRLRAGGHLQRRRARPTPQNPAVVAGLRHVPDYAYSSTASATTNEAVLERSCAPRRCTTSATTPTTWPRSRCGTRGGCSTSPGCSARARPPRRSPSTTAGPTAGVICFWIFAALALAGAFTAQARGAAVVCGRCRC